MPAAAKARNKMKQPLFYFKNLKFKTSSIIFSRTLGVLLGAAASGIFLNPFNFKAIFPNKAFNSAQTWDRNDGPVNKDPADYQLQVQQNQQNQQNQDESSSLMDFNPIIDAPLVNQNLAEINPNFNDISSIQVQIEPALNEQSNELPAENMISLINNQSSFINLEGNAVLQNVQENLLEQHAAIAENQADLLVNLNEAANVVQNVVQNLSEASHMAHQLSSGYAIGPLSWTATGALILFSAALSFLIYRAVAYFHADTTAASVNFSSEDLKRFRGLMRGLGPESSR